jgi:hypothetical protein
MASRPESDPAVVKARAKRQARMDAGQYTGDVREGAAPRSQCGCADCVRQDPTRTRILEARQQDRRAVIKALNRLRGNW